MLCIYLIVSAFYDLWFILLLGFCGLFDCCDFCGLLDYYDFMVCLIVET